MYQHRSYYCHSHHCAVIAVDMIIVVSTDSRPIMIKLHVELAAAILHAVVILIHYDCISGFEYAFVVNIPLHVNSWQDGVALSAMLYSKSGYIDIL